MRKIDNNYLYLTKQKDFNSKLLKYFYERVCIFLCSDTHESPKVIFTSNAKKIEMIYNDSEVTIKNLPRAFYSDTDNSIIFYADRYNVQKEIYGFDISDAEKGYKYVIPLSDIYHELIHCIQFQNQEKNYMNMLYVDFIESTDEMFTYFITGQYNIEHSYYRSVLSLWYIARMILKLPSTKLYNFIRDCIVDKDFVNRYFLSNKNFLKILGKQYNGDINKFIGRFKLDFFDEDYNEQFNKEIKYIHNLIFYKY